MALPWDRWLCLRFTSYRQELRMLLTPGSTDIELTTCDSSVYVHALCYASSAMVQRILLLYKYQTSYTVSYNCDKWCKCIIYHFSLFHNNLILHVIHFYLNNLYIQLFCVGPHWLSDHWGFFRLLLAVWNNYIIFITWSKWYVLI